MHFEALDQIVSVLFSIIFPQTESLKRLLRRIRIKIPTTLPLTNMMTMNPTKNESFQISVCCLLNIQRQILHEYSEREKLTIYPTGTGFKWVGKDKEREIRRLLN